MALCWKARERESTRRKWWYFLNLSLLILWSVHTMRCFLIYNKFIVSTFYIGVFKKLWDFSPFSGETYTPGLVFWSSNLSPVCNGFLRFTSECNTCRFLGDQHDRQATHWSPYTKIRFCSHFASTTKTLQFMGAVMYFFTFQQIWWKFRTVLTKQMMFIEEVMS